MKRLPGRHGVLQTLLIACELIWGPGIRAQEPLTLEEALEIASARNLSLRQQREESRGAELMARVASARRLPTLDFSVSSTYLSRVNTIDLSQTIGVPGRRVQLGGHDRSEILLSVQQPIFTGFRLSAEAEAARHRADAAEAEFERLQQEVRHQVHNLFYEAQRLYTQRDILRVSLKRLDVQLKHVRNLFQAGQIMAFDTLQVYNTRLSVRMQLDNSHRLIRLVNLQMANLLNLDQVRPLTALALSPPSEAPADPETLVDRALKQRPELRGVRLAQLGALSEQRAARSAYYPTVFASGHFHYAKPGLDPVANDWMEYFSVGLDVRWNLWHWGADRRRVEALEARYRRLVLQEQEVESAIRLQVAKSLENVQFSLEEWRLARELEAQEAERYRIISLQQENGLAATPDVLTAEADLTRAQLQTRQALIDYYRHLANLKKATGRLGTSF